MRFPIITGTQSFPEGRVTDNTDEEVVNVVQAPEAVIVASVAGHEERTALEPESTVPKAAGQTSTAQAIEIIFVSAFLVKIKNITQWLLEK